MWNNLLKFSFEPDKMYLGCSSSKVWGKMQVNAVNSIKFCHPASRAKAFQSYDHLSINAYSMIFWVYAAWQLECSKNLRGKQRIVKAGKKITTARWIAMEGKWLEWARSTLDVTYLVGYSISPRRFSWSSHFCWGGSSEAVPKSKSSLLRYAFISAGAVPSEPPVKS